MWRGWTGIWVAVSLWCAGAAGCSTDGATKGEVVVPGEQAQPMRVRVATYNVHNLFDTVCDTGKCGASDYETVLNAGDYRQKVSDVSKGIWTLDADVLLLQEIERESGLQDVQATFAASVYPDYAFGETGAPASVDVAILTRGTITGVERYRSGFVYTAPDGSTRKLSRELLAAEVTLPNGAELTAFVAHLVSKVSDPGGDRRLAEAQYIRSVIEAYIQAHPGRLVVFGGDLNDDPGTAPIEVFDRSEVLVRDTASMALEEILTWREQAAFDHLYHNAAFDAFRAKTERICGATVKQGLSSSDHCGLKSTFYLEDKK